MKNVQRVPLAAIAAVFLASAPEALIGADNPVKFAFGFEGQPSEVRGAPGEERVLRIFPTLTTLDNSSPDGAQGWSFGISIDGKDVVAFESISLKGVVVSTIYDQDSDRDPGTPSIHYDPYPFDLRNGFTSIALKCNYRPNLDPGLGVASAVVMNGLEKMVLQPDGTQRVADLRIKVTMPPGPECVTVTLRYLNGAKCGASQPINNAVTFQGAGYRPELGSITFLVCSTGFRRGDMNSDGVVDISDPIGSLGFLYLGGDIPGCMKAADANDDGQVDISDPVFTLLDLFSPGGGTGISSPGPFFCGGDPTFDSLTCLQSTGCP